MTGDIITHSIATVEADIAPEPLAQRLKVKPGQSLLGLQTGISPIDLPGGWRIIGYTPLALFDVNRDPPFIFAPGDTARFAPIVEIELPYAAQSH